MTQAQTTKWNGCIPRGSVSARHYAGSSAGPACILLPEWYDYALPTLNQNGSSCVGHAWANWLEMMIRRYIGSSAIPAGMQIDGEAIYARARELWWVPVKGGGIYLEQGFGAMLEMGIIRPESRLMHVGASRNEVASALQRTPLVQAHQVHDGWFHANPTSGLIDHRPAPEPGDEYHATVLITLGITPGYHVPYRVSQNSWGKDYARFGYFAMTEHEWFEGFCADGLLTADMPTEWISWDGWKKWLIPGGAK